MNNKTIVFSGFHKYGDWLKNSSELVIERLHSQSITGVDVHSMIFDPIIPQVTNRGEALFMLAQKVGAAGVVSLGMSSEAKGLQIVVIARNKVGGKYVPDALAGTRISTSMTSDAPLANTSIGKWRITNFRQKCQEEKLAVADPSYDAGGFVCNHLLWQLCAAQTEEIAVPFVFLHLPCTPECVPDNALFEREKKITMSVDQMIRGLELLLEYAII